MSDPLAALRSLVANAHTHPDAALIRLAKELMDNWEITDAFCAANDTINRPPAEEALIEAWTEEFHDLSQRIAETPATTLEGLKAKATVLMNQACPGDCRPPEPDDDNYMAWSLAADVLHISECPAPGVLT